MHWDFISSLESQWETVRREGQPLSFRKGQVLFYEGHYPYGLFVLMSGQVSFTREGIPSGDDHRWPFLKREAIGVEALVKNEAYCCTCTAVRDCQAVFLSKTQLVPFLKKEEK